MTHLYYVRHAQPDYSIHDDPTRPLTEKGMRDCALVTAFLTDKSIDRVFSSPYKRAVDTVQPFAAQAHLPVTLIGDLRERRSIPFGSTILKASARHSGRTLTTATKTASVCARCRNATSKRCKKFC